jgi:hypothetical protein
VDVRREDIDDAARRGILTPEQAARLWRALEQGAAVPAADPPARGKAGAAAGGALAVTAVVLAGLAVHALQRALGIGHAGAPTDLGDWFVSHELAPLAASAVTCALALRALRLPGLAAVLVAIAWFAAMTAAPAIFGSAPTWSQRALLSALVGVLALGTAFGLDRRTRRDYAFWLYLAGLVAFWGGLTTYHEGRGLSPVLDGLVNGWLIAAGLLIRRRVLAVFGAIGLAAAAGRAAQAQLVPDALSVAFAGIVLGLVAGAFLYVRLETRGRRALTGRLPAGLRGVLPPDATR